MRITFNIEYRTRWGESLYVLGSVPALGAGKQDDALLMEHDSDANCWSLTVDVPDSQADFEYGYIVINSDTGHVRREWGKMRRFLPSDAKEYLLADRWQDLPWDKPYYSSAFTDCINRRPSADKPVPFMPGRITLMVSAPMVGPGKVLAVSGSSEALGAWNTRKALRMDDALFPIWSVSIDCGILPDEGCEFKFLILDEKTGDVVSWEGGSNRRLPLGAVPGLATVVSGLRFINMQQPWRGAGTAIPVFSLRSEADFGVGDFYDLMPLIDWAAATGQSFIQVLPINDTTMTGTWTDSYPYNANSTFALHPMYLRLSAMGQLNDAKRQAWYDDLAKELNALPQVDYERVNNAKNAYARLIFEQQGAKQMDTPEFKAFLDRNMHWLKPYAAYCVLRDRFNTADFSKWGEYAVYDQARIDEFVEANKQQIQQVYFVQYHLDKQMRHVRDYAHSKGVAIKGDIPIGISRTSVDAWMYPQLFYLQSQAGAPPDDFSVLGQNWGFPTYNWEQMSLDGFAWWKARMVKMSEYFDAYRIDHVLGFFRIWEIPMDAIHGLLGHFNPALPYSADELRNSYDFWIDVDRQTTPYITDAMLPDFFGEYADEARERFLVHIGDGRYRLKDEVDTQRKVAKLFEGLDKDERNARLCNALMGLLDQVLFIPDPEKPWLYHPRISAQFTYAYRALNDYERWCFDRLYDDFFYHRHNDFWYGKAMWKLPPLIDATDMLVCAEDLGMIPACVPAVLSALQILSLEIQRMPKDPGQPFGLPQHYPYYSVCTTSTHDMSGIRGWWEEDRHKTQLFYNSVLGEQGPAPYYAEPWICQRIVDMHLKSPSMLCILPLQDWLSVDGSLRRENPQEEQINVPANSRHYWRYRMHLTLEELLRHSDFNALIRGLIADSGR